MVTVWLNCSFISLTPLPLPHYLKRGIFSYMLKRNKENFWPIEAGYLFAASIKGSNEYKQYHHQVHIRSHCHNDIDFEFLNRKPSNVFFFKFYQNFVSVDFWSPRLSWCLWELDFRSKVSEGQIITLCLIALQTCLVMYPLISIHKGLVVHRCIPPKSTFFS